MKICKEILKLILQIPIKILDWKRKRDDAEEKNGNCENKHNT